MKVGRLIARSKHCLIVQIFGGLISYRLMAINCREQYNEKVSIERIRELRIKINNEFMGFEQSNNPEFDDYDFDLKDLFQGYSINKTGHY